MCVCNYVIGVCVCCMCMCMLHSKQHILDGSERRCVCGGGGCVCVVRLGCLYVCVCEYMCVCIRLYNE